MSKKLTIKSGRFKNWRLITVDLDDTLWPCAPTIQKAEAELFAWLVRHSPRLAGAHTPQTLREHRRQVAAAEPRLAHDLTRVRRESLRLLCREYGYPTRMADLASDRFRRARNRVDPFPEVAAALGRLRQQYVLVSVTNGNAQVEHTALAHCFHHSLTAADVGAAKPDPALFEAALRFAAATPVQALHVGDDPYLDIAAAQAAGLTAVWMNRTGAIWPAELPPPDAEICDLTGLLPLLGLP